MSVITFGGGKKMNVSDVWDWVFMWQMFRNFMATLSPFVMMLVAVALAGGLIAIVVSIFMWWRNR